jgi:hypothetical protein
MVFHLEVLPIVYCLRFPRLGYWLKVKPNELNVVFRCGLTKAEDMSFKDKDVKIAQSIFKEQEEKPDRVDYEFNIWNGKSSFLAH